MGFILSTRLFTYDEFSSVTHRQYKSSDVEHTWPLDFTYWTIYSGTMKECGVPP